MFRTKRKRKKFKGDEMRVIFSWLYSNWLTSLIYGLSHWSFQLDNFQLRLLKHGKSSLSVDIKKAHRNFLKYSPAFFWFLSVNALKCFFLENFKFQQILEPLKNFVAFDCLKNRIQVSSLSIFPNKVHSFAANAVNFQVFHSGENKTIIHLSKYHRIQF